MSDEKKDDNVTANNLITPDHVLSRLDHARAGLA